METETFVPEIANGVELRPGSKYCLVAKVWMLQPGEARIVGRRIREILKDA